MKREILHLNLKKEWFDMVLSGEKKEENREIKKHWIKRVLRFNGNDPEDFYMSMDEFIYEIKKDQMTVKECLDCYDFSFKKYDVIEFKNGWKRKDGTPAPKFKIELKSIGINYGNPKWGAEKGVKYFVLELGEIHEVGK